MKTTGTDPRPKADSPNPFRNPTVWVILLVALGLLLFVPFLHTPAAQREELDFTEVIERVRAGQVRSVRIYEETHRITGEYHDDGQPLDSSVTGFQAQGSNDQNTRILVPLLLERSVSYRNVPPSALMKIIAYILPILLIVGLFYFLIMRQLRSAGSGGILSFGKSRAVRIERNKNRKTFDDVAGIEEAKEEVMEIVEFLRNPARFENLGGRLPHGVLLIGQPGTGKTLLAKAIAGEADVPFFSISGSDFVEMFVGVGASRVRDLFEQAKSNAPSIIFLDEVDAVGRRRANDLPGGGQEAAQTLNAILVEMDGFTSDDKVIVLAATNRPDVLDPALLRPGRFDRRIIVDLPDIKGREEILRVHSKKIKLAPDVDLTILARGTPTFSGAELENLMNEAALIAAFSDKEAVDMVCVEEARDKVRWGKEKRSRQMRAEDKRSTAYHEAGHALLMHLLPHVTPLHKVTIIPRGRALGATMQLPERDEYNMTRKRLFGEIVVRLGGRAAEEIFLDDITNGAQNDFEQATGLARSMVCEWGMSEALGMVHYKDRTDERAMFETREFSERTAEKIDNEVRRIIDECHEEGRTLLREHREDVELLVEALLEFEVLTREEFTALLESGTLDTVRELRKVSPPLQRPRDADADAEPETVPEDEISSDDADDATPGDDAASASSTDSDAPSSHAWGEPASAHGSPHKSQADGADMDVTTTQGGAADAQVDSSSGSTPHASARPGAANAATRPVQDTPDDAPPPSDMVDRT